jgi:hypothetical protein
VRKIFSFAIFFCLIGLQIHAQQSTTKADTTFPSVTRDVILSTTPDTISPCFIPAPGPQFVSFTVTVYLPKSKIWVGRAIVGNTIPADVGILFCSQGSGTIIIYNEIVGIDLAGKKFSLPERKYIVR